MSVPKTLITNDPTAVRSFFHEQCRGQMIAKVVSKGVLDPDGLYLPGDARFLHTNVVQPEHLEALDGIRVTAHLFQEFVPKALDLCVVVIGRQVFAVEIFSQASERTKVDWRRFYPDLTYGVHHLPQDIEHKLLQLVRQFGLQFSSADFILTPSGDYYFLELNPTGQFLWSAPKTGKQDCRWRRPWQICYTIQKCIAYQRCADAKVPDQRESTSSRSIGCRPASQ